MSESHPIYCSHFKFPPGACLNLPMAQFKTACTKFGNGHGDLLKNLRAKFYFLRRWRAVMKNEIIGEKSTSNMYKGNMVRCKFFQPWRKWNGYVY